MIVQPKGNMSWLGSKLRINHGIKACCRYSSLSFTCMATHSSMDLDCIPSVVIDHNSLGAPLPQSVGIKKVASGRETQSIEEVFHLLKSSEGERLIVENYIHLCGKCRNMKDLEYARRILVYVQNAGLEDHSVINYNLVWMLIECGSLRDAHQLFKRVVHPSEQCWTYLIRAFNQGGQPETALDLFQKLQQHAAHGSKHAITAALRAYTNLQDLENGRVAHAKVAEEMLEMDEFVSNTLVDMYCKCSSLSDAQVVFDRLQNRDLVSWNALIGGYAEYGTILSLQQCLEKMRVDGVSPDDVTYLIILKFCGGDELPERLHGVHTEILKRGFDGIQSVGNNLVHVYAKLGFIAEAQLVLDQQLPPNNIAWTALVGGHVEYGNLEDALSCTERMERYGVSPCDVTFTCILKACGCARDGIATGRKLYTEVVKRAFETHVFVGNSLVDMYCKCGSLVEAQAVFDKLRTPDVISWTALLSGYVEHGLSEKALSCLSQMQADGVPPNGISYLSGLRACQSIENLHKGQELHAEIIKEEFEGDQALGNTLIDFYVNCGLLLEAQEVFEQLPVKDVVSWNALITGFAEQGDAEMTLHCLKKMELEGISPSSTTFLCSLKACGSLCTLFLVQELHMRAIKTGFEGDTSLKNSLVDAYSKCGLMLEAEKVFYSLGERDTISWNSLMGGYADAGLCMEVFDCLDRMPKEGVAPDAPTFLAVLKTCRLLGFLDRGHVVHAMVMKAGLEREPYVASTLVGMYAMHGKLVDAELVFGQQQVQSMVTWHALIAGYTEHGEAEKALEAYAHMQEDGVTPDDSLYVCVLKACTYTGVIDKGRNLYGEVMKVGILEQSVLFSSRMSNKATSVKQTSRVSRVDVIGLSLHNAVIDMFCKCGCLVDAQKAFDRMLTRDPVTWNTLITGHALLGNPESSILLFDKSKSQDVWPDVVTYASVLTACNHGGFIESGQIFIEEMSQVYDLLPLRQHYNCIIDLLARAGQLDVALAFVEKIPFQPDLVAWTAVLGGCRISGNTELGRHAFQCSVSLLEDCLAGFALMSSTYVNAQMWEDAKEIDVIRAMLCRAGIG
ncbi:hypothetical protein GOP47_0025167 [Adiantum capillus-veneris]|uniref:Pentatricopeptide repeat-containing protein n=1 Tax=Adiantum capillus-veneris TaxID=13818 RepID=A0A9D4U464_ADICA|nr:hypothetical protein GOP47_0025167 [Adiantum capillus-veneris]